MNKNLRVKGLVILGVILLSTYMIIGIPKSKDELMANLKQNIRLGLDLKGGSHLVVQIQVHEAFMAEADRVMEQLKEAMAKAGISYGSMDRNSPNSLQTADTIQIDVKGVPLDKTGPFRTIITEQFGQWVQAYSSDGYRALFKAAGFDLFATYPSLTGEADDADFVVLLGRRSHPTS